MMLNYYQENKIVYCRHLKKLDTILNGINYSIYLRGSASKPIIHLPYKPWDIDLVLFSLEEIKCELLEKVREETFIFNDKISSLGFPHIDIRFLIKPKNNSSDKYFLYLLRKDSHILQGENNKAIDTAENPNKQELCDLYRKNINIAVKKHDYLCGKIMLSHDYRHRIQNLIKSISRCGCILLLLFEDVFTRDVNSGLDALHKYVIDDSFINIKLPLMGQDYIHYINIALIKMQCYQME